MATYPIKMLKDEQNQPFVPLVSTDCIRDENNQTLQQVLDKKLSPTNLLPGEYVSITTEGNNCYVNVDLPASLNVINNLTTNSAGQGALDAYQGKVLKDSIPQVINDLSSTSTVNALSANQGYVLNNKFNNYLPLTGGTVSEAIIVASPTPHLILKDTINSYNSTPSSTNYPCLLWTDKNNNAIGRLECIESSDGARLMSLYAIQPGTTTGGAFFKVGWNSSGKAVSSVDGDFTVGKNLIVNNGITVGEGFGKKYTFSKTLTITTEWQDTGIVYSNMPTGSYIVYMTGIYDTNMSWQAGNIYTGLLSWFNGGTNSTERYEINLHTGGHAHNEYEIYLATYSHGDNTINTTLQIKSNKAFTRATTINFVFTKI